MAYQQCDQIGRFKKNLFAKFLSKISQKIGNFLGYFVKPHPNVIAVVATFWALLDTFGIFFTPTSSQPDLFSIGQANLLFNCPFTPHW